MKATRLCSIMLGLLLTTAVQASVEINEETFPDEDFRSVIANMPEGKDGILTDEEIAGIEELEVLWNLPNEVSSLKGIEFFTNLKTFDLAYRHIRELDFSANKKLEFIRMDLLPLEKINLKGLTSLKYFICQRSALSELDVSDCTELEFLCCDECSLKSFDLSNNIKLKKLVLWATQLPTLDLSNNINLKEVDLWDNQLTTLDLSNNINLEKVDCSYNQLTSLILPRTETLTDVKCFANHLSGESMDQVIAMLPTVAKGDFYPYIEIANVDDEGPRTEFNVCTTSQVEAAKSKNWTVYGIYHVTSGLWDEYAGSEPTSIRPAIQGSAASDCYSLDGRRINWQDRYKGIYIQNGKKVVVK